MSTVGTVDVSSKSLNLATRLVEWSTKLMDAVRELDAINSEYSGSGISFTPDSVPMDFSGTSLKHINGADIVAVLTSAAATKAWLETSFNDNNFDRVRP